MRSSALSFALIMLLTLAALVGSAQAQEPMLPHAQLFPTPIPIPTLTPTPALVWRGEVTTGDAVLAGLIAFASIPLWVLVFLTLRAEWRRSWKS